MRMLALCSLLFAAPIAPATAPPPRETPPTTSVKTCPVTNYGRGIYKFDCANGILFPVELAEFFAEHPSHEIVTVSPINYYDTTHGYLVVTRTK